MPNQYVNKVVQRGGNTLIDISDTTAVASDVASGKYFYLATGEKVAGTASGGGGITVTDVTNANGTGTVVTGDAAVLTTKSITQNGTYAASSDNADGYSSVTVNVTNQDYNDALTAFGVQSNLASGITALTTYANEITGESDTTLSDAVRSLADGYGQGGGSDQSLIKSADLTMSETYTNANKLTVALEARTACVILVWADELPSAPESGYTAIFGSFFVASGISQTKDGRILRANGTVGTDGAMLSFNTTTGILSLGGQYGYFREGMTYHIRQYEF